MGFPYGLNEDAAFMTTWLELHNLNGIEKLSNLSINYKKNFKKKIDIKSLKSNKIINLNNTSLLYNGPGLFDIFYEKIKSFKNLEIILSNCNDPIYIIPLSKIISKKMFCVKACWINKNYIYSMNMQGNNISLGKINKNIKILKGQVIIQLSLNKKYYKWKNNLNIDSICQKINFKIEQKQLENSLKPKKKYWNQISKVAYRTFVPSSIKSRESGAGGGNDND